MAEVVLERLTKTYPNGVAAVHEVNLHIAEGECLALVGPSGSGKTTLLRLIAGLETPTSGNIRIGERIVNDLPPHRRQTAMVFQRPALYPHLSVHENLAFGLKLRRNDERIREAAEQLGLEDLLDRRPATLSGGQQQRVALGRALLRKPAVFLLDEPLSNLDARLRWEMRRELHLLHRRLQATMVYVTHDQDEAMTLGERVAVLDQGRIRQVDTPQRLYDKPCDRFVAGFLGWPPMNFLDGELIAVEEQLLFANKDVRWTFAGLPEWRRFVGQTLTLGIRPEDVRLSGEPGEGRLGMKVQLVERLGSVHWATLTAANWTVLARCSPASALEEGASRFVAFDPGRAHWFDPATGHLKSASQF